MNCHYKKNLIYCSLHMKKLKKEGGDFVSFLKKKKSLYFNYSLDFKENAIEFSLKISFVESIYYFFVDIRCN